MSSLNIELNNKAVNLSNRGDHESAVTSLNKALLASTSIGSSPTTIPNPTLVLDNECLEQEGFQFKYEEYDEGLRIFSELIFIPSTSIDQSIVKATIFYNLGIIHDRLQDDEEASNYFMKTRDLLKDCKSLIHCPVEEDAESEFGGPSEIAILHNLGNIEYRAGRYAQAEKLYRDALQIAQKREDYFHKEVAASMNCIGVSQLHKFNETDSSSEAFGLFTEAIAIYRSLDDDLCTATVQNNLGRVLVMRGDIEEALSTYKEVLQLRKKLLGSKHLDVAATIFNTGETLHLLGDLDEALDMYLQFLPIASSHLGKYHSDIICALRIVADAFREKHDMKRAFEFYSKALQGARKAYSPIHAEVASILNKIGNLHYEEGSLEDALKCYENGLVIERKVYDDADPNILVTVFNIARIYHNEKMLEDALGMYEEGLEVQRKIGKGEILNSAGTLSSIGLIYNDMGEFSNAVEAFEEALQIRRSHLGSEHFDVSSTLNSIGLSLFNDGRNEEALESFQESLRIRRAIGTTTHRDVATVLYNIATVYLEMDDTNNSLTYYKACLILERASESNSGMVSSLKRIGQVYQRKKELGLALETYQEAVELCLTDHLANANHAEIAALFGLIGNIYLSKGDTLNAAKTFSRAIRSNQIVGLDGYANLGVEPEILSALAKKYPNYSVSS